MKDNLILLHGALGAKSNFETLVPLLAENFEVQPIDFTGHGTRAGQGRLSMAAFSRDLELALRQNTRGKTHVFGYSMGGYVALQMALNPPSHWGKLICLGTLVDWDPIRGQREASRLNPTKIAAEHPAFAAYLASLHGAEHWAQLVEQTAELLQSLGQSPPVRDSDWAQIKLPSLILRGEKDSMLPLAEAQNLAAKLPLGRFQSLASGLHPIEKQDFSLLAQSLTQFIYS